MILDQTAWAIAQLPAYTSSGYMEIIRRTVLKREAQDLRIKMFTARDVRARYVVISLKGKKALR